MKTNSIAPILSIIIFFTGCSARLAFLDSSLVRTISTDFYEERWYRNPDIKDSRMLGSSTADYGASAEKKRDKYIIRYFSSTTGEEIPSSDIYKVKKSEKFWAKHFTKEEYMENKERTYKMVLQKYTFTDDNQSKEALEKKKKENGITGLNIANGTRADYIVKGKEIMNKDDWEDNPNQFYYEKDEKGNYILYYHIDIASYKEYGIIPIKQCFEDGWCQVYEKDDGKIVYVKKSILYK